MTKLISINALKTHPKNMRRFYKAEEITQMAASIKKQGGVIHPLVVVQEGATYLVVDGNKRLRAAQSLNDPHLQLECKVVKANQAEQLLLMATTLIRSNPDPVSEGLHYAALQSEGLSVAKISIETGHSEARIRHMLAVAALDAPIREMIEQEELWHDLRIVNALMTIADSTERIRVANHLRGLSIKECLVVIEKANVARLPKRPRGRPADPNKRRAPTTPMTTMAQSAGGAPRTQPYAYDEMRVAARRMCAACDIKMTELKNRYDEPAWKVIADHANAVCKECSLNDLRNLAACRQCPGVELLKLIIATK